MNRFAVPALFAGILFPCFAVIGEDAKETPPPWGDASCYVQPAAVNGWTGSAEGWTVFRGTGRFTVETAEKCMHGQSLRCTAETYVQTSGSPQLLWFGRNFPKRLDVSRAKRMTFALKTSKVSWGLECLAVAVKDTYGRQIIAYMPLVEYNGRWGMLDKGLQDLKSEKWTGNLEIDFSKIVSICFMVNLNKQFKSPDETFSVWLEGLSFYTEKK